MDAKRFQRIAKALADPRRFEIFEEMAASPDELSCWAPWCAPCRAMTPAVEAAAQSLTGKAKVYKLNVDDNPSVSPRFNIRGIPTMILFKDGQEANRLVGLSSREQIEALAGK